MRNLALISLCLLSILGASAQQDISSLISKAVFENMLKHRNDAACQGKGFYTYEAFIAAAKAFGGFGTTGDDATKKREIAAFLAQTSHETTGGWASAPDGPYAWGYCFVTEGGSSGNPGDYCVANQQYPCAAGKKYFGRGPIQISYNYNYGPAGRAIGSNLLANPELVATDPTISFKTALWFWMTPQSPKPSSHDVITGRWTPSAADSAAGRVPGYGVITNIINGGIECGKGSTPQQEDRIGFYKRYSGIMGVGTGNNLDCNNQRPFANYNYGPAGKAIGSDLLANPDLVATDATVSFKTALWFWMTPQSPKPSSHDVITGRWTPSASDSAAGRVPGYGVIANIINGGIECGKGSTPQQDDRIGFYKRYSGIMVVDSGNNIDCNNQRPFA